MTLSLATDTFPMTNVGEGWFEAEAFAEANQAYGFILPAGKVVPDPAARAQVGGVHGPSRLVDPATYDWRCEWSGRPWNEAIIYELHVGAFSETHDFDGVIGHLDHLRDVGVSAIELCPVAQFSGMRGWGYDGVLLYAPHISYGGPDRLKRLIDAAHERGLMVILDVVYNHFGPDGNYLSLYAPQFFNSCENTPWGPAIDFTQSAVRRFFVDNALYWLAEYRFDGLRLDAVDQIRDSSAESILFEIAQSVRNFDFGRLVHLTTEDDRNITYLHERDASGRPSLYDSEWNDDFHHAAHVLATGESTGYYGDYIDEPHTAMMIALTEGFVQQGGPSFFRGGSPRGQPSKHLPPLAFINFLQNHDQVGNRAFGERLTTLAENQAIEVLTALLLLSPAIPLIFMGEEWGAETPFRFFCDFEGELAQKVREGRRSEFARWPEFSDLVLRETIPDPSDPDTFAQSVLDWRLRYTLSGRQRVTFVRTLLSIRCREIVPRLPDVTTMNGKGRLLGERGIAVSWRSSDTHLCVTANLGGSPFASSQRVSNCLGMAILRGTVGQ
jgi:maltooligosyltrehalose trehalohydrolase